ncbi:MAG: SLC13 family permease, partial [Gammaproteobacteria bacterium]
VALRNAERLKIPASLLLMPLAFASLLGGLVTLIGTPPNIVIAAARASATGTAFGMFDFTPVGLSVAIAGLVYLTFIGWRLVPRTRSGDAREVTAEHLRGYLTEAALAPGSVLDGANIRQLEERTEREITVMAVLRGERRILAPLNDERLQGNDILILQGDPALLAPLFEGGALTQVADRSPGFDDVHSADVQVVEAVVMPRAAVDGQSARAVGMHDRYGVNLLALARSGQAPVARLARIRLRIGDVLLVQGTRDALARALPELGCLALAGAGTRLMKARRSAVPSFVFVLAILAAALGWLPVQLAFVSAVAVIVLYGALPLRLLYKSVEWPVIVLIAALIPIGEALQATGATQLVGNAIIALAGDLPTWGLLAVLMAGAMALSDLVHNTPTAVLMAPVAVAVADAIGLPPDPFLMAVAVGAASPYLTPIGHQSNTLVMTPAGYRFSDYWRVGLPMDVVILGVGVSAIGVFWL